MNIIIRNCKNIDYGTVTIEEGKLNIKYAINGTGKSTIAQVIDCVASDGDIGDFIPYKYKHENPIEEEHAPYAELSDTVTKVAIFNEVYVQQYIFQSSELIADSFEVFVKTANYDEELERIHELIKNIHEAFRNNPHLETLINDLSVFINGFGKAQSGYSKTGAIGKGVARGNKVENIPPALVEYKAYIQSDKNAKWLSWQSNGEEFLDYAEKCPYCATSLTHEAKAVVKQVAIEYDSKYVAELQKMLAVFNALHEYFVDSTRDKITELSNSSTEFTREQINYLKEIKEQVRILYENLCTIRGFDFGTLKDVDAVVTKLTNSKVDLSYLSHLNSPHTQECIMQINNALDEVIINAGRLQGQIAIHKRHIADTIKKYNSQINSFLQSAGYQYCVDIIEEGGREEYRMVLKSKVTDNPIDSVKERLSYGERNAFALVLFMYKALKDNPDLIILDDPISSFDQNKKYAIMEKLFKGQESLQGKTVVMLTHDFDPVVDMIHTTSIRCRFCPCPVGSFLYNQNGILHESNIGPHDIQSFFEIANYNIENAPDEINRLIYLRRLYEACGRKDMGWQLLSNVFHPDRQTPIYQEAEQDPRPMTEEEVADGTNIIRARIPNFEYNRIYARAHDVAQMISLYRSTTSNYEKIQIYRLIYHGDINDTVFKKFVDEVYHIENDNLFQLNPALFPTIPSYIIELCDNGIDILESELTY